MAPPGVDEKTLPPADKKADGIGVVSVADLKLLKVLPAGSDPEQTAVTSDGQRLFVANEDTGLLTALAVADGRTLATFKVGDEPEGVEIRPDGRRGLRDVRRRQPGVGDRRGVAETAQDLQGGPASAVHDVPARQHAAPTSPPRTAGPWRSSTRRSTSCSRRSSCPAS